MEIVAVAFMCGCCLSLIIAAAALWYILCKVWGTYQRARRILP